MSSITGGEKFLVRKNWKRIVQFTRYHQNKVGNPLVANRNVFFCLNLHQFLILNPTADTLPHFCWLIMSQLTLNVWVTDSLTHCSSCYSELKMLNITILVIPQFSLLRESVSSDQTNRYWLHWTDIKSCSIRQSISLIWNLISGWGGGRWSTDLQGRVLTDNIGLVPCERLWLEKVSDQQICFSAGP